MAKIRRGNVVLRVSDEADVIKHYLQLGYDLVDESGAVLQKAVPTDLGMLQKAYAEHLQRIAELEDTVAKLTAELTAKTTKKSSKKADND